MIWRRLLLTVALLAVGVFRCQGQTTEADETTVIYETTIVYGTDISTQPPPTTTTAAAATTTTTQPTTTRGSTTLMQVTPISSLIEEGGVEVELEALITTTADETFDEDEFRRVMADAANIWCTRDPGDDPEHCETTDPVMVHANDVVVYRTDECPDIEFDCENDDNIVVGFYITKPTASHEVLMTTEQLEAMLRTYEVEIEEQLGYGIVPPKEVVVEDDDGLEPWVIALIFFLILCVIVLIIILVVRNRRKKRLAKMGPDADLELTMNGRPSASPGKGPGKEMKDEGTLVYQAWILKAMEQDEIGTQVRSADILRAMKEDDVSTQVRSADIKNDVKHAPLVTHVDETKGDSPRSTTRASIESGPSSDDDSQMVPPDYEQLIDPGPPVAKKEPEPEPTVTVSVTATATKDAPGPGDDPSASVTVSVTKTVTDPPPPPPPPPPASGPPLEDTLPPPPEVKALQEFDKLIDDGGDSPITPASYDNPAYEVIDHETGTGLQDGSLVTAL